MRGGLTMRQISHGLLWLVKGLLLVIALGALVIWPCSFGPDGAEINKHGNGLWLSHWNSRTIGTDKPEHIRYEFWCKEGRINIQRGWFHPPKHEVQPEDFEEGGFLGFKWEVGWSQASRGKFGSWGQIFWALDDIRTKEGSHNISFPCWMLAVLAGAWPLASLSFVAIRRWRAWQLPRAGCCRTCGYDLRATPDAGGELQSICPECGTITAKGEME
jgi:hypothetical protein